MGLTSSGDLAKIHDPIWHLSPERATVYRQCVHSDWASSDELMALAPFVRNQGTNFRTEILLF